MHGADPHRPLQPHSGTQARQDNPSDQMRPDAEAASVTHAQLSQSEIRTILLCLMLAMFLAALDQTIVATALPSIGRQFNDFASLSWVISAYLLASTAVAPLFGSLCDIYGRRAMIILSLTLFTAGSVLCAIAPNLLLLVLARVIQGIGGGGILPVVQTIIADIISPRERGKYQAYFSGVWAFAGVGGPVLGGVFSEYLHWSMIFWINLPLSIVALALLLPRMARIPVYHRLRKVDWLGAALLTASALAFMLVLTWGGTKFAWLSMPIIALLCAAALLALLFVWHAKREGEAFIPLALLGGRVVPYGIYCGAAVVGAMLGLTVTLPLYYETVYGLSASQAGLALIPIAAISVLGAAVSGKSLAYVKRYKRGPMLGTFAATIAALILTFATPMPLTWLLILLSIFAAGFGTVFPFSIVTIQNAVAKTQVGTVTGAMNFFRALMGAFCVAAFSTILVLQLGPGLSLVGEHLRANTATETAQMVEAFRYVFAAATILLGTAFITIVVMEESPLSGEQERVISEN